MKNILKLSIIGLLLLSGCNPDKNGSDAYGSFESDPVIVSSAMQGEIISLFVEEGQVLEEGITVGVIDTMQLHLKRQQLKAAISTLETKFTTLNSQMKTQQVQIRNVAREAERVKRLFEDGAATEKQLDDVTGSLELMETQLKALESQKATLNAEKQSLEVQVAQVHDQLEKASIRNPLKGTVLQRYKQQGEIVGPGQSIYKIAGLDKLILRAYISGNQLSSIALGQEVTVLIDQEEGLLELPGKVKWIASEAEFTPKIIQTREERVNLVYAVKIEVENEDGILKIGMPGEVKL